MYLRRQINANFSLGFNFNVLNNRHRNILNLLKFFMINQIVRDRPTKLFIVFAAFFVANALIAECIGGKVFSLEKLFGFQPSDFTLFGYSGLSLSLTCGVLLWPLEFVMTDIVNEYYGPKAVKRISYIAVALISYAFLMFYASIHIPSADWWPASKTQEGIADLQVAYSGIFGQGMWIIAGSLIAFLIGQLVDVFIFHRIKKITGEKKVWLRATGSTLVSQLIDSFIVLTIAFKIGSDWTWTQVLAVGCVNYAYKFIVAVGLTPVIYFAESAIERYVGKEKAVQMKKEAMGLI